MKMKSVVIFDIDGTLTQAHDVDCKLFFETVAEELGIPKVDGNLSHFPDVTDSGIVHQLFLAHKKRPPTVEEFLLIEDRFAQRLSSAVGNSIFYERMHGAIEFVERLEREGFEVGIATGNWRKSGAIKLKSLGLERFVQTAATSSDSRSRKEILALAFARINENGDNSSNWYIGDGHWDVRAAKDLGVNFLGIGEKLRNHGLKCWFENFSNPTEIMSSMELRK